jgi:hypothetical protein
MSRLTQWILSLWKPTRNRIPFSLLFVGAVVPFCLTAMVRLATHVGTGVTSIGEAGYGDAFVIHDVLHYWRTGVTYRDFSTPPYTATIYGPLLYRALALSYHVVGTDNPFLGPRLVVLFAFIGCVLAAGVLAERLQRTTRAAFIGAGLACTPAALSDWILQVRGDLPAVFCGLLALLLVVSGQRAALVGAGALVALAPLFKSSYVAVPVAIVVWLLLRRRGVDAIVFGASVLAVAIGGLLTFIVLEPEMLTNLRALPVLPEYRGAVHLIWEVAREPVVWLAAVAVVVRRHDSSTFQLLALAAVASGAVAVATSIQIGANINYYFELMFLCSVLATYPLTHLLRNISPVRLAAACGITVVLWVVPNGVVANLKQAYSTVSQGSGGSDAVWTPLERALDGRRVFTTLPRVAMMQAVPVITEPFLHSVWERTGRQDTRAIADSILRGEYEAVVTSPERPSYRGLPHVTESISQAISTAYVPFCTTKKFTVHLPRTDAPVELPETMAKALREAECRTTE